MARSIYKQKFLVRFSEIDSVGKLKISTLENYFAEAASLHGHEMKVSHFYNDKRGITWLLTKVRMKIERLPRVWEEVEIETWPLKPTRVACLRDFIIRDKAQNLLVYGTSKWCLADISTRKLVSYESVEGRDDPVYEQKRAGFEDFDNFSEESFTLQDTGTIVPKYTDLDYNGHVNNVKYFDYAFNALGVEKASALNVKEFQINFINEAFPDKTIQMRVGERSVEKDTEILIQGEDMETSRKIFQLKLVCN